jgi:hypothetical protein
MGFSLEVSVDEPDRAEVLLLKDSGYLKHGEKKLQNPG